MAWKSGIFQKDGHHPAAKAASSSREVPKFSGFGPEIFPPLFGKNPRPLPRGNPLLGMALW